MGEQLEQRSGASGPRWLELLAHPEHPLGPAVLDLRLHQPEETVGYTCPRWIPDQPVNQNGGVEQLRSAVGPNLFNYLQLPIDPNTGIPVNAGDALAVPNLPVPRPRKLRVQHQRTAARPPQCLHADPGFWNFNFVAAKTFKLTERFNLQFRGEFYNAFNHSNYYIPDGNLDVEDGTGVTAIQAEKGVPHGGPTNPTERRNIQFGLKLNF